MAKRILVVDDDELVLDSLGALLTNKGYEAFTARNSFEALDLLDREVFGLVLCDVRLPGISGIETIRSLRTTSEKMKRDNPNENVAVIFMSAYNETKIKSEAEKLAPIAFLVKPFEDALLLGLAEKIFQNLDTTEKNKSKKR